MRNFIKKQSGITLIALVVTIIVLIILAGVSINMLVGDNGILTKASEANERTKQANANEKLSIAVLGSKEIDENVNIDSLNNELKKIEALYNGNLVSNSNKIENLPVIVIVDTYEFGILGDGEIVKVETIDKVENTIYVPENTIVKDINNKNIVVPKGFTIRVDDSTANANTIEKGIVIEDREENQYVWIPVDGILGENGKTLQDAINGEIILGRYHFNSNAQIDMELTPTTLDGTLKQNAETVYGFKENIQNNDIKEFIKSVRENGGYYIARFEASQGANNKVESKSNKEVWNEITQPNAMDVCKNLYEEINSNLMNSYAWDTAILFIQKNSANNYSRQNSLNTELMNTGLSGDFQCNIYDMASNCLEWTTEIYDRQGYPYVGNGGHFGYAEAYTNSRNAPTSPSSIHYSFRSVLYL